MYKKGNFVYIFLNDIPQVFEGAANLGASDTGTQWELANRNLFITILVGKIIWPMRVRSNDETDGFILGQRRGKLRDTDRRCISGTDNFAASDRQMVGYWVFDDFEKLFSALRRSDRELVQQLNHQSRKTLKRARNTRMRMHFNKNIVSRADVHLQMTSLVQWRVQKRQKTLMRDIGAHFGYFATSFSQHICMVVTVHQLIRCVVALLAVLDLDGLQRRVFQDHDKTRFLFVCFDHFA